MAPVLASLHELWYVVGGVARIVQVGDDFDLHAGIGVGVDVVHRLGHIGLAVGHGSVQAAVVAGAGLAFEGRAGLQAVVAAHLECDDAGRGVLHVGPFRHDLVVVDIRRDGARLGAAYAFDVGIPQGGQVLGFHCGAGILLR